MLKKGKKEIRGKKKKKERWEENKNRVEIERERKRENGEKSLIRNRFQTFFQVPRLLLSS
jgi:hypothetical protein